MGIKLDPVTETWASPRSTRISDREGLVFERAPDLTDLQVGNPNLRSGVEITVRAAGHAPLRLLAMH